MPVPARAPRADAGGRARPRLHHGVRRRRDAGRADRARRALRRHPAEAGAPVRRDPGAAACDPAHRRAEPEALDAGRAAGAVARVLRRHRLAAAGVRPDVRAGWRPALPAAAGRSAAGARRLSERQPDLPPAGGRRRGARLGAGPRRRSDGGPGLDLRQPVALRHGRQAGRRLRRARGSVRRLRGGQRRAGRPRPRALLGGVRGAEVGRDVRRHDHIVPRRRPVGGARGDRPPRLGDRGRPDADAGPANGRAG